MTSMRAVVGRRARNCIPAFEDDSRVNFGTKGAARFWRVWRFGNSAF